MSETDSKKLLAAYGLTPAPIDVSKLEATKKTLERASTEESKRDQQVRRDYWETMKKWPVGC